MKRIITNVLIALQVLFFASCVTVHDTNLLQKPGLDIPSYPRIAATPEEYRVKVGDQLIVLVTTNPLDALTTQLFSSFSTYSMGMNSFSVGGTMENNNRSLSVHPDGTIYFPYVGEIYVKDKTTLEIQQLLEKKINEGISEDCVVKVYLENRSYSVIGESKTGRYMIPKEQMTIFQALAQSGDIQAYGDRRHVKIIRQLDNGTVIKSFDIRSQDIMNSEFYYIQPNDIIYIEPMARQFWGINSFYSLFAVVSTVLSLGVMFYNYVK